MSVYTNYKLTISGAGWEDILSTVFIQTITEEKLRPRINELECDHGVSILERDPAEIKKSPDVVYEQQGIYAKYHSNGSINICGRYFGACSGEDIIDNLNCLNTRTLKLYTVNGDIRKTLEGLSLFFDQTKIVLEEHSEMGVGSVSVYQDGQRECILGYSLSDDLEQNIIYHLYNDSEDAEYAQAFYQAYSKIKQELDKPNSVRAAYYQLKEECSKLALKYDAVGIVLAGWLMDIMINTDVECIKPNEL